jgi:hypothetical protein
MSRSIGSLASRAKGKEAVMKNDRIYYSKEIEGDKGNYNWPVKFDRTGGYVGISQMVDGKVERILLSPRQVRELIAFCSCKPARDVAGQEAKR